MPLKHRPYTFFCPLARAFTLVELVASIAILAILVAVSIPFIGNYVASARARTDEQTLLVLNDAINRYKMQGGNITALTSGKAFPSLLSALQAPVTWNGLTHQFLRSNQSFPNATTIASTGSGRSYRLTRFNSYQKESGSTAPLSAAPAWGGILATNTPVGDTYSQLTVTLTAGAPTAARAVVFLKTTRESTSIVSVSDSKGHTYTIDASMYQLTGRLTAIYGAFLTTPLVAGDTLTITYDTAFFHSESVLVGYITGVSNVGTPATSGSYSINYVLNPSAGGAPCIVLYQANYSPSSYTFTTTQGTEIQRFSYDSNNQGAVRIYKTSASSGAISTGGTLDTQLTSTRCAVAYW